MIDRLAEDHQNAKRLAEGLAQIQGIEVDLESVQTNMVYCTLTNSEISDKDFLARIQAKGLVFLSLTPRTFRMVTHHGIDKKDIETAIEIIEDIL